MLGNIITEDNWNFSFYKNEHFKAFISVCADYNENDNDSKHYIVHICDNDEVSIHEIKFEQLNKACRYINNKYCEVWDFNSLLQSTGGGCSTCVAH